MRGLAEKNNKRELKGRLEIADYKEQELSEYKNNPFIEALPNIFTDDDIIDKFLNVPIFEDDCENKTKNIRFHLLKRIKSYSQVFPIHILFESKLSAMIRRGYLARNPLEISYFKKLEILNDLRDNKLTTIEDIDYNLKFMRSTADSLTVLGISGIGKTTAIERLLLMYPQVIKHQTYNNKHFTRTQIVWLKIDCPYDGSLSTLCKSFFKAIDDILGTKYLEKFGYSSRITSTMMISMTKLASMYGIGILVIDEIQQLINSKNNVDEMLNFFVTLSNAVGIPTVLIGTPKAQEIFKGNFRQARRASSDGCIMWDRMDKESDEWNLLTVSLWELQCLQEYVELTDSLNNAFYEETQGITSVAINLFILAQERALMLGEEKLTVELIRETANKDLKLLQPMLHAIKSNNVREIAKFDDISIDFDAISNDIYNKLEISGRMEKIYEERKNDLELKRKNRTENLLIELKSLNIFQMLSDKDLISIVSKEVEKNPLDIGFDELKGLCIKNAMYKNDQMNIKNTKKGLVNLTNKDSLLKLYDAAINNKKHPYELLQRKGYIKNPMDDLVC